jgi:hypothetical protein
MVWEWRFGWFVTHLQKYYTIPYVFYSRKKESMINRVEVMQKAKAPNKV